MVWHRYRRPCRAHADSWQQPIKINNDTSFRFLKEGERVIVIDHATDSAVIVFSKAILISRKRP
jgi:hypothetical protein